MKLALAGSDVAMGGASHRGGGGATTLEPVGDDVTAAAGASGGDVFASTLAGLLVTTEGETGAIETATETTIQSSSRHAKAPPTMRRAIAKRKRLALDKALTSSAEAPSAIKNLSSAALASPRETCTDQSINQSISANERRRRRRRRRARSGSSGIANKCISK